ncbi:hypothetical protein JCM19235_5206 [Vibrio maritimus]|uniref:Uncharacterized protein n=1 Tax=Vibrio maritimus TaxID=990268 RepID=A0A090SAS1_9VIBR|nr:hypothetical protein JCM19235_5206 [Vibrio maritimus]
MASFSQWADAPLRGYLKMSALETTNITKLLINSELKVDNYREF